VKSAIERRPAYEHAAPRSASPPGKRISRSRRRAEPEDQRDAWMLSKRRLASDLQQMNSISCKLRAALDRRNSPARGSVRSPIDGVVSAD